MPWLCSRRTSLIMRKVIVISIGIIVLGILCYATVYPGPVKRAAVPGTWVGFSSLANDFYRIQLTDSNGLFAHTFTGEKPDLFRIESWEIGRKSQLKFVVRAISKEAEPIAITGRAHPWALELVLKSASPHSDWESDVTLYKEDLIENRISLLKQSMKTFHESQPSSLK
jgi:hypothetical protein